MNDVIIQPCHRFRSRLTRPPLNLGLGLSITSRLLFKRNLIEVGCISKPTIIASDNGLSPDRRQSIIWTNAGILLVGTLGTNVDGVLIEINYFDSREYDSKCRLLNDGIFISASLCYPCPYFNRCLAGLCESNCAMVCFFFFNNVLFHQ